MGQNPNWSELTEYDKKYYHYLSLTPWGAELLEQDLFRYLAVAYDKVDMLQKVLCKVCNPNVEVVYYGFGSYAMNIIRDMIGDRDNTICVGAFIPENDGRWRGSDIISSEEFLKEKRDDVVILFIPEADDNRAVDILLSAGYVMGDNLFTVPRLLVAKQGGYWR